MWHTTYLHVNHRRIRATESRLCRQPQPVVSEAFLASTLRTHQEGCEQYLEESMKYGLSDIVATTCERGIDTDALDVVHIDVQ